MKKGGILFKENKNKKMSKLVKRIITITLSAVLGIILILALVVGITWRNEIKTLASIKEIMPGGGEDGYVYEMTIHGDYFLDDYVSQGGIANDKELIKFLTGKITRGLFNLSIEESEIGCSSFSVKAENGDSIFGRNYDMSKTNVAIVHTKPKGRYQSISTVDLNFVGVDPDSKMKGIGSKFNTLAAAYAPLDGMNEKGLTLGIFMSYQGPNNESYSTDQNDPTKPNATSTVLLRMMLDYAATVDEAVAIAQRYNLHDSANTSFHYMVADANGDSAILEYVHGKDATDTDGTLRQLNVIRKGDAQDLSGTDKYQIITNFIITPGYYNEGDMKRGEDRYNIIKQALSERGGKVSNLEDAMDVLSLVGVNVTGLNGKKFYTIHSIVFNQTTKEVIWISNRHYGEEKYTKRYKLK